MKIVFYRLKNKKSDKYFKIYHDTINSGLEYITAINILHIKMYKYFSDYIKMQSTEERVTFMNDIGLSHSVDYDSFISDCFMQAKGINVGNKYNLILLLIQDYIKQLPSNVDNIATELGKEYENLFISLKCLGDVTEKVTTIKYEKEDLLKFLSNKEIVEYKINGVSLSLNMNIKLFLNSIYDTTHNVYAKIEND